jgi:hypothetical protein
MSIKPGQIVKHLSPTEPVVINKVQPLGPMVSITYTGVNTNKANSRVISIAEYEKLEVVTSEGTFTFKGTSKNSLPSPRDISRFFEGVF